MKLVKNKGTAHPKHLTLSFLKITILLLAGLALYGCGGGGNTSTFSSSVTSNPPPTSPPPTNGDPGCVGTALTEKVTDVSAQLSQLSGIKVKQLSDNGINTNTYSDVPSYSSSVGLLAYNHSIPSQIATATVDGANTQIISGAQIGQQVVVSVDGKYIYYEGRNSDETADVYGVQIGDSGNCQQIRMSSLSMTPIAPLGAIQISPSSIDPATNSNVIAFSEALILHRIEGSGMSWNALPDVTLPDPENTQVFHRIRLNPVFPNIIWWKRDAPNPNPNGAASPAIYVANLNATPIVAYSVAGTGVAAGHPAWSSNGLQLGYLVSGVWTVATILNSDGSFALQNGTFVSNQVGPPQASGLGVDYCTWSPDNSVFVCNTLGAPGDPIYLMSLNGTQTKILANTYTNSTTDAGIPKPGWLDKGHIIFATDWSGSPQIYVISGFTATFP